MRFIRPNDTPTLATRQGGRAVGRPRWFKEWIEDKPKFVLLSCAHKMDINVRAVTVIQSTFGNRHVQVLCEQCDSFVRIVQKLTLLEYHGIKAAEIPDEPLF